MMSRPKVTFSRIGKRATHAGSAAGLFLAVLFGTCAPAFAANGQTVRADAFATAARESGVPENVLLAVAYNESRWTPHTGMSADGGYGLMDLRTYQPTVVSGRDGSMKTPAREAASAYTLDQAAQLLHTSKQTLETNEQQNIRGGAAVLAQDARQLNGGQLPTALGGWYGAAAEYAGTNISPSSSFADDVFATIQSGASLVTADGQTLALPATPSAQPDKAALRTFAPNAAQPNGRARTTPTPECPVALTCRFIPAAYAQDDPNDPTNYGNYDPANRPQDMQIRYIFIHDGEGSYDDIVNHFQDPTAYDSAQYVISSQGDITQMVRNEDVSWGVGNWNMNMHGINIEHEGFAAQGASWYTEAMYESSATLVRWLATRYHIPMDREHILGHDNIMRAPAANQALQHWDPGPYWDWRYFMGLVKGETPAQAAASESDTSSQPVRPGDVVAITPDFATNKPVITDCQTGTCLPLPTQGANFVYLHTQPSDGSPLLSDQYLHTDGSAGTTVDNDWGDKAPAGFTYVVAAVDGNWTGVWYAGRVGWFYNPSGRGQTAMRTISPTLSPRPGLTSITVYVNAYPEASAYPSAIPAMPQGAAYTMPAGQTYATTGQTVGSDYYYDATINYSLPDDHAIVVGQQRYYEISFNHHVGFVKTQDVVVHE